MKIKLSKSQWEEMGKKAGWKKEAQVTGGKPIAPGTYKPRSLDWTPPAAPS